MHRALSWILPLALAIGASAQEVPPPPGLPLAVQLPSINSVRPAEVAVREPQDAPAELTVYVSNYLATLGEIEILWNGAPVPSTTSSTHPESRFVAEIPANQLLGEGSGIVTVRVGGLLESNAVTIDVVEEPETCPVNASPECGAAIGETPAIEMVPVHAWYPFVRAPAGGLVLLRNRDFAADFGNHTVTRTSVQQRVPLSDRVLGPPEDVPASDRFDVVVDSPPPGGLGAVEEYLRIPEADEAGSTIVFYCEQHGNAMEPPFGAILVE